VIAEKDLNVEGTMIVMKKPFFHKYVSPRTIAVQWAFCLILTKILILKHPNLQFGIHGVFGVGVQTFGIVLQIMEDPQQPQTKIQLSTPINTLLNVHFMKMNCVVKTSWLIVIRAWIAWMI